jgi:hypothetical protein
MIIVGGTVACTGVMLGVCLGLHGFGYNCDFKPEAWPSYQALAHGHVAAFFSLGPGYIGSLMLRAPFALIAIAAGGGWRPTYFASAVPCIAAAPALGVWLATRRRAPTGGRVWVSPLVLIAVNPIVLFCLILGHPEEILGACLCIAAVIVAAEGERPVTAGLLVALAVVNKPWALVAVPVVFAALPGGRVRAGVAFAAVTGLLYAPVALVHTGAGAASSLASQTGARFFYPPFLGWWLGPGAWVSRNAHVLIVLVASICAVCWWVLRARRESSPDRRYADALSLLALVLLLRGALDPWNNVYYELPFLFTLMAIESNRVPRLSVLFSVVLFVALQLGGILEESVNLRAITFDVAIVPTILVLALRVYASPATWGRLRTQAFTPVGDRQPRRRLGSVNA